MRTSVNGVYGGLILALGLFLAVVAFVLPASRRQLDLSGLVPQLLARLGLARNLKLPPPAVVERALEKAA